MSARRTRVALNAKDLEFLVSLCEMYRDEHAQYPELADLVAQAERLHGRLDRAHKQLYATAPPPNRPGNPRERRSRA